VRVETGLFEVVPPPLVAAPLLRVFTVPEPEPWEPEPWEREPTEPEPEPELVLEPLVRVVTTGAEGSAVPEDPVAEEPVTAECGPLVRVVGAPAAPAA